MGKLLELAARYVAAVKGDPTTCKRWGCENKLPEDAWQGMCSDECYTQYILDTSL
jgi:hypothetical protein